MYITGNDGFSWTFFSRQRVGHWPLAYTEWRSREEHSLLCELSSFRFHPFESKEGMKEKNLFQNIDSVLFFPIKVQYYCYIYATTVYFSRKWKTILITGIIRVENTATLLFCEITFIHPPICMCEYNIVIVSCSYVPKKRIWYLQVYKAIIYVQKWRFEWNNFVVHKRRRLRSKKWR